MARLQEPGLYPAPKGRGQEGEYHRYCLEHVRQYNKSYNYFAGMPDEDVAQHQKDDTIGHRPTWFVGVNSWARNRATRNGERRNGFAYRFATYDPLGLFGAKAEPAPSSRRRAAPGSCAGPSANACASSTSRTPPPRPRSRRASRIWLNATTPTATGGDRRSEDKLREVIQAYNYLRQAGLA